MRDYQWLLALALVVTAIAIQAQIRENDHVAAATAQVEAAGQTKSILRPPPPACIVAMTGTSYAESDFRGERRLRVGYSQGGLAEVVIVSSAGADRILDTADDIERAGLAMNFKGVGEGIQKNAGEVAKRAARGAVHGAIVGIKDGVKEAFKKDRAADEVATN